MKGMVLPTPKPPPRIKPRPYDELHCLVSQLIFEGHLEGCKGEHPSGKECEVDAEFLEEWEIASDLEFNMMRNLLSRIRPVPR